MLYNCTLYDHVSFPPGYLKQSTGLKAGLTKTLAGSVSHGNEFFPSISYFLNPSQIAKNWQSFSKSGKSIADPHRSQSRRRADPPRPCAQSCSCSPAPSSTRADSY